MFNLSQFHDKTIREIQHRQGGEQIIIYFTDDSFLIVTAEIRNGTWNHQTELQFSGQAVDK